MCAKSHLPRKTSFQTKPNIGGSIASKISSVRSENCMAGLFLASVVHFGPLTIQHFLHFFHVFKQGGNLFPQLFRHI